MSKLLSIFFGLHGDHQFAREVSSAGKALEAMGLRGQRSMAEFAKSADKLRQK